MEIFKENLKTEGASEEAPKEKASDIELAAFFIKHIENPCEVEVKDEEKVNIKPFYIREAKKVLKNMTNPFAIELLKKKIKEYEREDEKERKDKRL